MEVTEEEQEGMVGVEMDLLALLRAKGGGCLGYKHPVKLGSCSYTSISPGIGKFQHPKTIQFCIPVFAFVGHHFHRTG